MSTPGIILTSRYVLPGQKKESNNGSVSFSNYIDYMKREEALSNNSNRTESETLELSRIQSTISELTNSFSTEQVRKKITIQSEAESLIKAKSTDQINNDDFFKYANYMFRSAALREREEAGELSETEKKELAAITSEKEKILVNHSDQERDKYRRDEQVIPGAFSIRNDIIKSGEMKDIRRIVDNAQEKDTVMWQDVVSFDNNFLIKNGLLDPITQKLNEDKIKAASHKMMNRFIKEEKLNQPYWFASIHRNTDNIHIHFSTVEQNPNRNIIEYNGQLERKGKRKQVTIDKMKTTFGNDLLDINDLYSKISNLRNESVSLVRSELALDQEDSELINLMHSINGSLEDRWEYKIKANKVSYKKMDRSIQEKIDKAVGLVSSDNPEIKTKLEEYYLNTDTQNKMMEDLYGEKYDSNKTMKSKREEDMRERLGNAFLRGMADHKINSNENNKSTKENINNAGDKNFIILAYNKNANGQFKKFDYVDKLFWKIKQKEKREMQQEFENVMNTQKKRALNEYEEMMNSVEQSKANQHEY